MVISILKISIFKYSIILVAELWYVYPYEQSTNTMEILIHYYLPSIGLIVEVWIIYNLGSGSTHVKVKHNNILNEMIDLHQILSSLLNNRQIK